MKTIPIVLTALCMFLLAASCNNQQGYKSSEAASAVDSTAPGGETTVAGGHASAASADEKAMSLNGPERKTIRTADLRCRVADVYAATTRIERLVTATGGQIADSRMENSAEEMRSIPYKTDSLRELTSFTTTAHLTLRIPVAQLDTVLGDVASGAAFIHSRSLHLDDVTLRYLGNKLKNEAISTNDAAAQARKLARRSGEAIASGDYADARAESTVDRRIGNMQLMDEAAYATLTIDLYQPRRVSGLIVPDTEYLMKPGAGQQMALALSGGWQLLRGLLTGLLQIWPLLLIAAAGIVVFRRRFRNAGRKAAALPV